jgi:hypothetical protein
VSGHLDPEGEARRFTEAHRWPELSPRERAHLAIVELQAVDRLRALLASYRDAAIVELLALAPAEDRPEDLLR